MDPGQPKESLPWRIQDLSDVVGKIKPSMAPTNIGTPSNFSAKLLSRFWANFPGVVVYARGGAPTVFYIDLKSGSRISHKIVTVFCSSMKNRKVVEVRGLR